MKRVFDLVVSLVIGFTTLPVFLITCLVLVLVDGRPIFFLQRRIGLGGRPFSLIKFRTMRPGPGTDGDRLTTIGRFFRTFSLDELPQLINVVRGEMSLVGPRPLLPRYMGLYTERQSLRHNVRPGITGLAQVSGRNELSWPEKLELDVLYVENRSMAMDLGILVRTVPAVLLRRGISQPGQPTVEFLDTFLAREDGSEDETHPP